MTADTPTSAQRISSYDTMRVIAAVAVIAIHVVGAGIAARGLGSAMTPGLYNMYTFIWFATPSFAFLTGALIWAPRRPIRSWSEYRSFLRRRASIVLVPYLFWSVIYLLWGRFTPPALLPQMPIGSYLLDSAKLFLLGRASFHLYFIPVVLEFYLVAPLVSRGFARRPLLTWLVLWAIGAYTTLIIKAPTSEHLVTLYRMLQYTVWLLPAAAAGAWYGTVRDSVSGYLRWMWPLVLGFGLALRWLDRSPLLVTNDWQQRTVETTALVLTLIGLVSMLDVLVTRWPGCGPTAHYLGSLAFGVYLVHPVGIALATDAIEYFGVTGLWASPLFNLGIIAAIVALCFVAVGFLTRFRAVAWVFGRQATRPSPTRSEN